MRAALRDKRRAAAIAREVCCALESAGDMDGASEAWRQHRLRVAERLNVPVPGGVFRCQDGTLYAVDGFGTIHVARDAEGRKMRAPKARRSPFLAPGDTEKPDLGKALPVGSHGLVVEGARYHAHIGDHGEGLENPAWIGGAECHPDCTKSTGKGVVITDVDYPSGTVTANAAVLRANARTRRVGSHA